MRPPRTFVTGQEIAGVKILEIKQHPETRGKWEYLIQHQCCGKTRWMSHKVLTSRVLYRYDRCNICSRTDGIQAVNRRRANTKTRAKSTPKGRLVPGWGWCPYLK